MLRWIVLLMVVPIQVQMQVLAGSLGGCTGCHGRYDIGMFGQTDDLPTSDPISDPTLLTFDLIVPVLHVQSPFHPPLCAHAHPTLSPCTPRVCSLQAFIHTHSGFVIGDLQEQLMEVT
jgi:hypothetical protein